MARYEYSDIDEYKDYIVTRAKTRLLYKSNMIAQNDLTTILNYYFDNARNIIVKWRNLKTDDEFLSQKWDTEITDYIVNSFYRMGDETLASSNINGTNKSYAISPEAKLRSDVKQSM